MLVFGDFLLLKLAHMAKVRRRSGQVCPALLFCYLSRSSPINPSSTPRTTHRLLQIHTLQMTSKKLEAYRRETEQLFYSMSGAEIFFKRTDVDT